ncbi:unnamed protein product [Blepharisma stoltei]|uniref:Uncharacterized protein n=1 Tax=Blepharisma stoltei TaxID=1481888 RepID=A0AAU9JUA8_9CILI|nr:unnamed protein product [Blepharisma stoltei]
MEKRNSVSNVKSMQLTRSDFTLPLFKRKVFSKENKPAQVYNWKSSIPERWIEIKGLDHFKHVSEASNIKNTLDFLIASQKYINKISQPALEKYHSPKEHKSKKSLKPKTSKDQGKQVFEFNTPISKHLDPERIPIKPLKSKSSFTARQWPKKRFTNSLKTKYLIKSKFFQFEDYLIHENESLPYIQPVADKYTITKFALPNGLVSAHKENGEPDIKNISTQSNPRLEEFLKRFEKKSSTINTPKERKGVNGWKLTRGSLKSFLKKKMPPQRSNSDGPLMIAPKEENPQPSSIDEI